MQIVPTHHLYSSCFEIPEAAVNLQCRALGKRNYVKRLLKGEAYCPTSYGITVCNYTSCFPIVKQIKIYH
ncbi:MAG: hypothetical protein LBJ00_09270 [Planctomycetaceae bacterium]|nr:hypothetical protein [Planctomycetaceae bacterium]